MPNYYFLIIGVVGIYCIAQAVREFRSGNRLWAVAGIACAALLLLTPLPKIQAPVSAPATSN